MPQGESTTQTGRVLLVEDDADTRRFVRMAMRSEGHEVFEAATLERGMIEAGLRRPDLILLDLGYDHGPGVGFIRSLRAWSAVPLIVLSEQPRGDAQGDRLTRVPTTTW